ncbi:ABC transporter ATP-binding protein [Paenibacillus puldeungensis]|uniref:ABC transporter ATP-binding protein n=1 Tax=Paenibacillus puldeungensis TaxID=696536 RepID=A0ABW3RWW2_9BACL
MYKLTAYLKPFRKECILGPIFKLLEAILELLLPTMLALMINHGVAKHDTSYVIWIGLLMVLMSILGYGSSLICQYYAALASQGFGTLLRNKLYKHISGFSYAELDHFGTSSLINRITSDVNQLQLAVAMLIRLVIRAPFICIGALIMSMILDFRLSLVLMAATPILGLILYFIISRSAPMYRAYQQKLDRIAQLVSENLTGVRVIRAFAKRKGEKERFAKASEDLATTAIRVGRISSLLSPLTFLVLNGAIIAILWFGGIHIDEGRLSQGELIAFINYITQILLALIVVSNLIILFTKASSCAGRVNEVLEATSSIVDPVPAAIRDANEEKDQAAEQTVPVIRFSHVSFGYNTTGDTVLEDINVEIKRGETVGIIGSTGSGKSTFVQLLPRFYDVTTGEVLINGINVKNYTLRKLRRKIGIVPQKAILFSGTITENIRFGNEEASDEEVRLAAKIAQADEFIAGLPDGYNTSVARGGANLSGGQKQRLTIARALITNPDILILDDSASALDFITDAALRRSIAEHSRDMTVLLISQRVSTIRQADQIIVLENGKIAGVGKHDDLLGSCEVYQEIYISQTTSEVKSS